MMMISEIFFCLQTLLQLLLFFLFFFILQPRLFSIFLFYFQIYGKIKMKEKNIRIHFLEKNSLPINYTVNIA